MVEKRMVLSAAQPGAPGDAAALRRFPRSPHLAPLSACVGRDVVEQLIRGIEAEGANLGMVITSGAIADEATATAEEYFEEKGVRIELVDGEQFAKLIVEHGIRTS